MEAQTKTELTESDFPTINFSSIDSIRNFANSLAGAGHGAKLQFLRAKMMTLYPHHVENERTEGQDAQVEATLKKFLRRPGLPAK
jgi:hypothetical protein